MYLKVIFIVCVYYIPWNFYYIGLWKYLSSNVDFIFTINQLLEIYLFIIYTLYILYICISFQYNIETPYLNII